MNREVRITVGTTGTLLLLGGALVLFVGGLLMFGWAVLMFALGSGLVTGAIVSQNADIARELKEQQERKTTS